MDYTIFTDDYFTSRFFYITSSFTSILKSASDDITFIFGCFFQYGLGLLPSSAIDFRFFLLSETCSLAVFGVANAIFYNDWYLYR